MFTLVGEPLLPCTRPVLPLVDTTTEKLKNAMKRIRQLLYPVLFPHKPPTSGIKGEKKTDVI
jgi:hypothetical protein